MRTGEWARLMRRLGAVGAWPLNERSGTTAYDWSGFNRHGTYNGSPALWSRWMPDGTRCSDFDGSNDYVEMADDNAWSVQTTGALTIIASCVMDTLGSASTKYPCLVCKDDGTAANGEWYLYDGNTYASNVTRLSWFNEARAADYMTADGPAVVTGAWRSVIATMSTTPQAQLFINGRLVATDTTPSGTVASPGAAVLRVGQYTADANSTYDGAIGRVAILPYEITPAKAVAVHRAMFAR